MGCWENRQKLAKGENPYQSQFSWISLYSSPQREKNIFCTHLEDTSYLQGLLNIARNIYWQYVLAKSW